MSKEFKKIGSNIDLKGIVIHQVFKDAQDRNVSFKLAKSEIVIGEKEKLFIGKLTKAYYKKSNPVYGIFAGLETQFKSYLNEYLSHKKFFDFTVKATEYYKKILESTISATGGFLIFSDFMNSDTGCRYMLILTINNKDGYVVSESKLTLEDIKNLDLSKVDIACLINLTKWKEIEEGTDTESKTYLSFVRGMKNISYYFMSFIDCDNKTTSTESTKNLIKAFDAYSVEKKYPRETKINYQNQIYGYCDDCMKAKTEIHLSAISTLLDIDNPNDFEEFAADEKYAVSATIKGDRSQLKRIKYIIYKDEKYRLEFDSNLLGTDVIYNKQKKELTFKRLPDELINQIPG
ncbi:MAG: nucleoid-associated protein [Bacteroidia bacterium]